MQIGARAYRSVLGASRNGINCEKFACKMAENYYIIFRINYVQKIYVSPRLEHFSIHPLYIQYAPLNVKYWYPINIWSNIKIKSMIRITFYSTANDVKLTCRDVPCDSRSSFPRNSSHSNRLSFRGIPGDGPARGRTRCAGSTKFNVVANSRMSPDTVAQKYGQTMYFRDGKRTLRTIALRIISTRVSIDWSFNWALCSCNSLCYLASH